MESDKTSPGVLCSQQPCHGKSTETVMNSEKGNIDIVINNTTVKALVGTGASVSCIEPSAYQSLGLNTLALSEPNLIDTIPCRWWNITYNRDCSSSIHLCRIIFSPTSVMLLMRSLSLLFLEGTSFKLVKLTFL